MSLINFEVITASVAKAQLLVALEQVIPAQTIHRAIINTSSQERRERILPTHVVVALVIAMSFWSTDSIVDVFKNLIQGLSS
ncbi:transposase domain-containing protein [Sphaerospermopsis torques-reginae]|nr:transposase domain-containing protein [Sphaerospermopsis torques-reginae]